MISLFLFRLNKAKYTIEIVPDARDILIIFRKIAIDHICLYICILRFIKVWLFRIDSLLTIIYIKITNCI